MTVFTDAVLNFDSHIGYRESVICWSYRWETQGTNVDLTDEAKPSLSKIDIRTESFPSVTPTYGRLFFFLKMTILAFICKNPERLACNLSL